MLPSTVTIDVLAWPTADLEAFELCEDQRVVLQRFLLELLTDLNTIRFRQGRGCSFLSDMRSGKVKTELDVYGVFGVAEHTVRTNLNAEETDDMPDSMRYRQADLTRIVLQPNLATLTVEIHTYSTTTPIPVNITVSSIAD